MQHKRVVITGGAGFIGSNLVKSLLEGNNEIIVIDNLSTGKIENIKQFIDEHKIEFIKADITDYSTIYKILNNNAIDFVFHLAAQISVPMSLSHPQKTHEVNVTGTYNVLQAAAMSHVEKVVFSSSCAVYGNEHQNKAIKESDKPQPLNPYALSKLIGEQYCTLFSTCFNLKCVSLRYFNVYGPKQDPLGEYAAVIPKFIERVQNCQSPIIYGDGSQTRDFIFVEDVVKANMLAAEKEVQGIFNIATGVQISIRDLANTIMNCVDTDLQVIYEEPRACEIMKSIADITKANNELQFNISYPLNKGLEITISNFPNE